jgi:2-dehydro-3-deoxygluconokinase
VLVGGDQGACAFLTEGNRQLIPGFLVEEVVDPVGAGDGFAAGVISGLLDSLPLNRAVERGNAVGAMATMVQGDFEGLPDRLEIDRFTRSSKEEDVHR